MFFSHLRSASEAGSVGRVSGERKDAWDVFDAVLRPGDLILLMSWRTRTGAEVFENAVKLPSGARLRRVRIVRDYGMFDRREAPQYYPDVEPRGTWPVRREVVCLPDIETELFVANPVKD
jgi:hypothetical protein